MEKNNKIVLGAVFILLISGLSFNFLDSITGQAEQSVSDVFSTDLGAAFISQNVSTQLKAGDTAKVSIIMQNTGKTTWTKANNYKLGSQNPQDNLIWGLSRVELDSKDTISLGQQKKFTFDITAPSTPGTYNFQWKMLGLEENVKNVKNVNWFGQTTPNIGIDVIVLPVLPICTINDWSCTNWDLCQSNNQQTRSCTKTINCLTDNGKPAETQSCVVSADLINLPDLIIMDVNFVDINGNVPRQVVNTPYAGDRVSFDYIIKNIGIGTASFYNGIVMTPKITKDNVELTGLGPFITTLSLQAGASFTGGLAWSTILDVGNYCFKDFKIDSFNNIVEFDETNNIFTKCIQVVSNPSLP